MRQSTEKKINSNPNFELFHHQKHVEFHQILSKIFQSLVVLKYLGPLFLSFASTVARFLFVLMSEGICFVVVVFVMLL